MVYILAFVEQFLKEESARELREEEDVVDEFLPLFYAHNLIHSDGRPFALKDTPIQWCQIIIGQSFAVIFVFFRIFNGRILFVVLKKATMRGRRDVIIPVYSVYSAP